MEVTLYFFEPRAEAATPMGDANLPILKDDSGPTPLENLLRLLDRDRDRAGEKYEHLRRKLIKFFEWNSCFSPEDLADETLERLGQRIGTVNVLDVGGFAWGIAKNVRQEVRKRAGRIVHVEDMPGGEGRLPDPHDNEKDIHEKMQQERRVKCLHLCLQRIPESDRELFLAYHTVKGEHLQYRQELARRLGITLGALRVRVNRLRNHLEKCSRKCFASWQINGRRVP